MRYSDKGLQTRHMYRDRECKHDEILKRKVLQPQLQNKQLQRDKLYICVFFSSTYSSHVFVCLFVLKGEYIFDCLYISKDHENKS